MTCLAAPGYFCSQLNGSVLLCPANWYCLGGAYPPRACPASMWSAAGSATVDACRDNMETGFAVTVSLLVAFLFVFLGVWLCYAAALPPVYAQTYPPPVYPVPVTHGPPEARPLLDPRRCNSWGQYP